MLHLVLIATRASMLAEAGGSDLGAWLRGHPGAIPIIAFILYTVFRGGASSHG